MRVALFLVLVASVSLAKEPGLKQALNASYEFPAGVNRGAAKREAFQRGLGSASAGKVKSVIKQMKLMDKGMDDLDKKIVRLYDEYAKEQVKYDATIAAFHKKYGVDAPVPVTPQTGKNLDEARGRWTQATSIRRTEHSFQEWVVQRINEMIIVLPDDKHGAIISALAAGTRDRDRRQRARCLQLLAGLGERTATEALMRLLVSEKDPLALAQAIEVTVTRKPAGLTELLETLLDRPEWQTRAAAIRGLARIRTRKSTQILIARLGYEDGRMVEEILASLESLTGRSGEPDVESWNAWLKERDDSWKPSPSHVRPRRHHSGDLRVFRIKTRSKRLVFCLDISDRSKLVWRRIKPDVEKALDQLPEDSKFTIVVFNADVKAWKKTLVFANAGNKASAKEFLAKIKPGGPANTYGAFEACLKLADPSAVGGSPNTADTAYFVATSMPSAGVLHNPFHIGEEIQRRNRINGLRIHMVDMTGNPQAAFLEEIAGASGGRYVGPPR